VAKQGLNVSKLAQRLHTSQPGISSQIKQLEDELKVQIFERNGKRLVGITEPGKMILALAEKVILEADNIRRVGNEYADQEHGTLIIATTHTQARYALPKAVKQFTQQYPHVRLRIQQGNPTQVSELAVSGKADLVIATEAVNKFSELAVMPCYQWNRCVVTPLDHPLLRQPSLTLEDLVNYPIITYDSAFAGRTLINKAFDAKGLTPNVVLTAIDSDVIKTYVELGLGIGLLAEMAFEPERDKALRAIDASHLFENSTTNLGIRRGKYLQTYMYAFIELFAPQLSREVVDRSMYAEKLGT
jgi:LysR family cys regulon transcriptional activator